jgi:toluene monooxygenase system protein D
MTAEGVGPVLEAGEIAEAIIAAIREANSGVEVQNRGSYVRVTVSERCVLERRAVERILGRPFRLPGDLEELMPSFSGRISFGVEEVVWSRGGS